MTLSLSVRPVAAIQPSDALRAQLLRRAAHLCKWRFDPEDLVQEVLLSNLPWLQRSGDLPEHAVTARLFRCLTNAFISRLRRADAVERYARGVPAGEPAAPPPEEAEDVASWETVTDGELRAGMACLSPKQQEVFLAVTAGERYATIAARLGLSANAVAKRAFDARRRLRKELLEVIARRPPPPPGRGR